VRLARYTARRLLLLIPVLIGISIFTFVLIRVLPGDPIRTIVPETATEADIAAARERYGLDRPLPVQYGVYLSSLLRGDLGRSFQTNIAVREQLLERIAPTLQLTTLALLVALAVAIPVGIFSALRAGRFGDQVARVGALAGSAFSEFWLGLLLILIFYSYLQVVPPPSGRIAYDVDLQTITHMEVVDSIITGNLAALGSALHHLALPVATLAIISSAPLIRSVRASALQVLASESYRCAEAHGLPRQLLARRYLLRESLISLPTLVALIYGYLLGGAVLVEYVFSWQGFGQWALQGLLLRDYPVIQAFVLISATLYVLVFLVADLVHAVLDPRVRL
jgi:peptide/nickel transport system permease protein